jgi:hypothetical protein
MNTTDTSNTITGDTTNAAGDTTRH